VAAGPGTVGSARRGDRAGQNRLRTARQTEQHKNWTALRGLAVCQS